MTTKEETLRRIQVMQAWCDGEKIESKDSNGKWMSMSFPSWDWTCNEYRIAPKPKRKVRHRGYISDYGMVYMFCGDEPAQGFIRAPWLDGEVEVDD